uniref:LRAT domain-containing protein n=1 Tax=Salarias fasciatus TaxID=181472 RepID=A0A672J6R4_SALFA
TTPTLLSKNPEPGDLIEISRGGYQHWAVYVGDGYVVHLTAACGSSPNGLSSPPNKKALVKKEKLQDAVGTDEWKVNNILDKKYRPRPVDVIVREACAREGQELPYGIATRNCEHFATELRYGKAESQQVGNHETVTYVGHRLACLSCWLARCQGTKKKEDKATH